MEPETAITELKNCRVFNNVMLVGHEPDFSALTAKLLGARADSIHLGKASLTAIELDGDGLDRGSLVFSISVKLMRS